MADGDYDEDMIVPARKRDFPHERWITVTEGGAGWFAVHMWINREDIPGQAFPEPWDSGYGRYATREEAEVEARAWAADEGLPFVG